MKDKEFEENYYNIEDIKSYMKVPLSKKFEFLEEMNKFLDEITPKESKKISRKLKEQGY